MPGGVAEFAVSGERGIDVFRRVDDANQRRYRYECIATVLETCGTISAYNDHARKNPDRVHSAVERFHQTPFLKHPVTFGEPASYPKAAEICSTIDVFLYLDFFRMWQIAEQEISRMSELAASGTFCSGPEISSVLRLLLDFNQIQRAHPLILAFLPALKAIAATGKDDKWQNTGFSLRMIGDLQLRAGQPADALAAYEQAISLGDNPHRRGLAIRAAYAAQQPHATFAHLAAFESQWPLPEPLAEIRRTVAQSGTGA